MRGLFAELFVELLEALHADGVAVRKAVLVEVGVGVLQGVIVVLEDMVQSRDARHLIAALRERRGIRRAAEGRHPRLVAMDAVALSMKVSLTSLSALTVPLRSR